MQLCAPRVTVLPAHVFMNCSDVEGTLADGAGIIGAGGADDDVEEEGEAEGAGGFALGFGGAFADAHASRRSR